MGITCRLCGASGEEQTFCSSCQRPLAADPQSLVSQTIGSHQIQRFVGEGPIGMVFDATHTPSGERVRLKIIDSELLSKEPELIEKANQLIVGSTGMHDSLPELMEVTLEQAEVRFVSVQWLDGETLREKLSKGPLQEVDACLIMGGVLKALDALHSSGLAYGDLKPENVLIAPEGSSPMVHLLDVGPSVFSARARQGAYYRSPEQARGGSILAEPSSDIYAVGVLLYEALSGRKPFESNDYDVLMSQISLRRPPPLGQHCPHVNPALLQVVSKAMEPMPANRFSSAVEMLRAVRAFISEQERPSLPERRLSIPQPEAQAPELTAPVSEAPAVAQDSMLARDDLPPPPAHRAQPAQEGFHFETDSAPLPFAPDDEPPTSPRSSPEEGIAAQPQGSGMKIAGIVFVVIALVVGGVLLYFTFSSREEPEPTAATTGEDQDATKAPDTTTPSKSLGTINVKLNGLPEGAIFYVDGRRLGANPFRAPKSPAVHKIRVEAPDHEPFETEVSFGDDQEIAVEMTPIEADDGPTHFKAHTKGLRANQRSWKRGPLRLSVKRTKSGPDPDKAPDQLHDRTTSTPH